VTTENIQSLGIKTLDQLYGQMVTAAGINAPAIGVPQGVGITSQGGRPGAGTLGLTGRLRRVQGFVTPTNGATSPSWYQFCRVPSDAIILSVEAILASGTITTFTGDVTIAHSDAFDGTPYRVQVLGPPSALSAAPGNALICNPAGTTTGLSGSAAAFATAFALSGLAAKVWTELAFSGSGSFSYANQLLSTGDVNQPLWQFVGFTADPKGNFDIGVLTTVTNSVASAVIGMRVTYVDNAG
jgi:hypothetical protein